MEKIEVSLVSKRISSQIVLGQIENTDRLYRPAMLKYLSRNISNLRTGMHMHISVFLTTFSNLKRKLEREYTDDK